MHSKLRIYSKQEQISNSSNFLGRIAFKYNLVHHKYMNKIVLKARPTQSKSNQIIDLGIKQYSTLENEIYSLIQSIKNRISKLEPLELLTCLYFIGKKAMQESIYSCNANLSLLGEARAVEYIQSLYTSSGLILQREFQNLTKDDLHQILDEITNLYQKLDEFYYSWECLFDKKNPQIRDSEKDFILNSQKILSFSRGNRYECHNTEALQLLLTSQYNSLLMEIYNIKSSDIINGFRKLSSQVARGAQESILKDQSLHQEFKRYKGDIDKFKIKYKKEIDDSNIINIFNVEKNTGWPTSLIKDLSWEIGECKTFNNYEEFNEWPLLELPIKQRPFIRINNVSYCFDYYSLVDNFYRVLQTAIRRKNKKEYNVRINSLQKEASENAIKNIFKKLLPDCEIYTNNFYLPPQKKKGQETENDILIKYDSVLLIIEIKAAKLMNMPPILATTDYKKTYETLAKEAANQCERMKQYLEKSKEAKLYDGKNNLKEKVDISNIQDIFMITVSIDNINTFANQIVRLNFLGISGDVLCLSMDELLVYKDYFENPLFFLHYLKHRREAGKIEKYISDDELNHLGAYIQENNYEKCITEDLNNVDKIYSYGARDSLDEYFYKKGINQKAKKLFKLSQPS